MGKQFGKSNNLSKKITLFFLTLILLSVVLGSYLLHWINTPNLHANNTYYYVNAGSSFSKVSRDLSQVNVISSAILFKIYGRILDVTSSLKPGTYFFDKNETPANILHKMLDGDSYKIKITFAEGLNIYQLSEKLTGFFPKNSKETWIALMSDQAILNLLPESIQTRNLEGFIVPDTYFFDPNEKPKRVIEMLVTTFKDRVTHEMFKQAEARGLTPLQFITLASIIEKETSLREETKLIAGVFFNRLKIKMKLQSDPTVIYGMWSTYNGNITKKDLLTPTEYNTYTQVGLPPGPISNPSLATLKAVLNPAQTEALYFVASGTGGHVFSKTYEEHLQAVRRYINYIRASEVSH